MASNNPLLSKLEKAGIKFSIASMKVDSSVAKTDNEWTKHLVENQILRLEKKGSSYKVYGKGEHGEISLVGSVPVSDLYDIEKPVVAIPFDIQETETSTQGLYKLDKMQPVILLEDYPTQSNIEYFKLKKQSKKKVISGCMGCAGFFIFGLLGGGSILAVGF